MRRRSGMTLIEMVAVMSLLGVFVVVAGRLTVRLGVVNRDASRAMASSGGAEQALRRLRADAWGAENLGLESPSVLRLDGVTWLYEPGPSRLLRRTPAAEEVFPLAAAVEWSVEAGGVRLKVGHTELVMPSQMVRLREPRR